MKNLQGYLSRLFPNVKAIYKPEWKQMYLFDEQFQEDMWFVDNNMQVCIYVEDATELDAMADKPLEQMKRQWIYQKTGAMLTPVAYMYQIDWQSIMEALSSKDSTNKLNQTKRPLLRKEQEQRSNCLRLLYSNL